jgi:thioredoxin reductase
MDLDVLVIGGGAAGLSGATVLARSRRRVLVVDAGEPRNAPAEGVHNFLSRDGMPPRELLAVGREELESYGGEVRAGTATSARVIDGGFAVTLDDGDILTARRLLVSTGLVDELPEVEGLREHWGTGVLHCPFCHGWEVRDQPLVVLATGPMAGHQALMFAQLTDDVTLVLHEQPDLPDGEAARLSAMGVTVRSGRVDRVLSDATGVTAVEVDGAVVPCSAVVVAPFMRVRSAVLESLGVAIEDLVALGATVGTYVPSDPMTGMTSLAGVHVAGNVTDPQAQVVVAAGAGMRAGAAINGGLIQQDAARLVAG